MQNSTDITYTRRAGINAAAALLICGTAAGPLFVAIVCIQAFSHAGFDITRHPPSLLSLGSLGWLQILNFVAAGLLFIGGAVGMRRASATKWSSVLIGAFGVSMIIGGLFPVDGGLGFPAGAPVGRPSTMSWHAMVHLAALATGFASLAAACVVFARDDWAAGRRRWSTYSAAVGVLAATCFVAVNTGLTNGNLLPLWLALVVGWTWASVMPARLVRLAWHGSERNYVFSDVPRQH